MLIVARGRAIARFRQRGLALATSERFLTILSFPAETGNTAATRVGAAKSLLFDRRFDSMAIVVILDLLLLLAAFG